jgi:hypothetical protein
MLAERVGRLVERVGRLAERVGRLAERVGVLANPWIYLGFSRRLFRRPPPWSPAA